MPFTRYVEIGRVALINYGEDYGKLVVISDVIDQNRALVDRPDMVRKQINFKRLVLTDFKIEIPRLAKKKVLSAALEESGAPPHRAPNVVEKFNNSAWGRKLAKRASKAAMTDFDRYKATMSKVKRAASVREALHKLQGKASKSADA